MYNQVELEQLSDLAREWIIEAGQRLIHSLTEELTIEFKTSAADLVTEKDKEIEQFLGSKILEKYPNHYILGEEGIHKSNFEALQDWIWIIDPIDGTTNFVHQQKNFSISVALAYQGEIILGFIYDPVQQDMYHALKGNGAYKNNVLLPKLAGTVLAHSVIGINPLWLTPNRYYNHFPLQELVQAMRGTRSYGSAALELAYVADRTLDGYISLRLSPWDYAAGLLIVQEVGGIATDINGAALPLFAERASVCVANPQLHHEIRTVLNEG